MEWGDISHRTVEANGINIHVAEKGEGPVVLPLHGFPELWYSWRHQIVGLAARGYHAMAPDLRGYGDTSVPLSYTSYTILHLAGDVISLMDALDLNQVFLVGHDWGSWVAWHVSLFRPDRVKALVSLSVPYVPRSWAIKPLEYFPALYGDNYYIVRFQDPAGVEEQFAEVGFKQVLKKVLTYHEPAPMYIPRQGWISPDENIPLPSWLKEEDMDFCASKFAQSGFTGPLNYYRCLDLNWELTAPWTWKEIKVPAKFIVGEEDLSYHLPGADLYINYGGLKEYVPLLLEVAVIQGVGHFSNQESPNQITLHIFDFIRQF